MDKTEAPTASAGRTIDAFLGGKLVLLQPRTGYRAGLDAVLLAATVPAGKGAIIADLGAGVGTVGLSAVTRVSSLHAVLVERDASLAALACDNIARNNLGPRADLIVADFEIQPAAELEALGLAADRFDHVVANPPFQIEGNGRNPPDPLKA
ncbi:MAG: methyltransferase, partial [Hyphomicrobiaceae bacterium]